MKIDKMPIKLRMKLKPRFSLTVAAFIFLLLLPFILFAQEIVEIPSLPEITNSNKDATAYFWVKKLDGTTKVIEVPPVSQVQLPADITDFQYLYMEGGKNAKALPEQPSFHLAESSEPIDRGLDEKQARKETEKKALDSLEFPLVSPVRGVEKPKRSFSRLQQFFEENW